MRGKYVFKSQRNFGANDTPIAAEVRPSNFGVFHPKRLGTPNIRRTSTNPEKDELTRMSRPALASGAIVPLNRFDKDQKARDPPKPT